MQSGERGNQCASHGASLVPLSRAFSTNERHAYAKEKAQRLAHRYASALCTVKSWQARRALYALSTEEYSSVRGSLSEKPLPTALTDPPFKKSGVWSLFEHRREQMFSSAIVRTSPNARFGFEPFWDKELASGEVY